MSPMAITTEKPTQRETIAVPARFHFVDGLRALCALLVVEHHIFYEIFESKQWFAVDPSLQFLTGWLRHGYIAVAGFIVLSGFCLMLPVVANTSTILAGGIKGFLRRRARRILPPYYAALGLSLALLLLVPGFSQPSGFHWDWSLPAFSKNAIISHLFLVHNLNPAWIAKIDHPLWSIAIEWQIYFVFAIVLIPIVRKFGIVASVVAACVLGAVPGVVFHTLDWTRPWYLGLFSLGMLAATVASSRHPIAAFARKNVPWSALTVLFAVIEIYCASAGTWQTCNEIVTALALMCCLVWGSSFDQMRATTIGKLAMAALTAPMLVGVGIFSYSVYLIHAPLIALTRMGLESLSFTPTMIYGLLIVLGTIVSVAGGYAFFLAIECRFLSKGKPATEHRPSGRRIRPLRHSAAARARLNLVHLDGGPGSSQDTY